MTATRVLATLLAVAIVLSGTVAPADIGDQEAAAEEVATPARISYIYGQVSFWRPGAAEWVPATLNTPLAPGDLLYTGSDGTAEIQVGARAFLRAAIGTQLGLENQEPDFIQFKMTAGHAALDLREFAAGQTIELDTPNAALTVERTGFYGVEVGEDRSVFIARRGARAILTSVGAAAVAVASNQQLIVTGTESPRIERAAAPALVDWERWNYQRTSQLLDSASAKYVPVGVYGTHELDQHGTWRVLETYGPVWVPRAVPVGWVPYSTGRWIWDPIYGWTWLDDAPWGWAPYHYGRWVFVGSSWAWAPGPIVVRPVYAPALVAFFGGGPIVVSPAVFWVALGWGEPIVPWWGHRGFVGRPWWGGWGGPRLVNNVAVNKTTIVNVNHITVYRNASVTNAVVGVPAERFGRDHVAKVRVARADARRLEPVRGSLPIKPVAASVMPASGPAAKPPASVVKRAVVATRAPREVSASLRAEGLAPNPTPAAPGTSSPGASVAAPTEAAAPKLVPAPPRGAAARSRDNHESGARAENRQPGEATQPDRTRRPGKARQTDQITRPDQTEQPRNGKDGTSQPPSATTAPRSALPGPAQPSDVKSSRPTPLPSPQRERGTRRDGAASEPRTGSGGEVPPTAPTTPTLRVAPPAPPAPPAGTEPPRGPERPDRSERPDRMERSASPSRPGQWVGRPTPPPRPERVERPDRNERAERSGRAAQGLPPTQVEQPETRQRRADPEMQAESQASRPEFRSRPRPREQPRKSGEREDAASR